MFEQNKAMTGDDLRDFAGGRLFPYLAGIDTVTFDLSVKNPNGGDEVALRTPAEILDEIAALDAESSEVLATTRGLM